MITSFGLPLLDTVNSWTGHCSIDRVGIESTGSYAVGLVRYLSSRESPVLEVRTPCAHTRARKGKDDRIDVEAARELPALTAVRRYGPVAVAVAVGTRGEDLSAV